MLMSILQKVQSSVQTVIICKVKVHTGVLGNEYADEAAKRATELLADDRTSQQPVACAADAAPPYTEMYWPVIASSSQLQDDDTHGNRGPVWVNDINKALKHHLHIPDPQAWAQHHRQHVLQDVAKDSVRRRLPHQQCISE